MPPMSATAFRKDIYNAIARVNEDHVPLPITNSKGKGAVLVGEDDWAAIEETLHLASVPGMAKTLAAGSAEPLEECFGEDDLEW